MKLFLMACLMIASINAFAKGEDFAGIDKSKFSNGDVVLLKEQAFKGPDGENRYYSDCKGLIYEIKAERSLWNDEEEEKIKYSYWIQVNCPNMEENAPVAHRWFSSKDIKKLLKHKQTSPFESEKVVAK